MICTVAVQPGALAIFRYRSRLQAFNHVLMCFQSAAGGSTHGQQASHAARRHASNRVVAVTLHSQVMYKQGVAIIMLYTRLKSKSSAAHSAKTCSVPKAAHHVLYYLMALCALCRWRQIVVSDEGLQERLLRHGCVRQRALPEWVLWKLIPANAGCRVLVQQTCDQIFKRYADVCTQKRSMR